MGGRTWSAVVGVVLTTGCLEIPRHQAVAPDAPDACAPGDNDCDGWPADGVNDAADDCNDDDATINPGALDLPGGVDQDCIGGDSPPHLPGVSATQEMLVTDDLVVTFDAPTGMPSEMTIGGQSILQQQSIACAISNEEAIGVSLYPALALHTRSGVAGSTTVAAAGPALASVRVSSTTQVDSCDVTATVAAELHFIALPGSRLVRADSVTVTAASDVEMCSGCPSGLTAPILSSYISLDPVLFDQFSVDRGPPEPFPTSPPLLPTVTNTTRMCMNRSTGTPNVKLAMSWRFAGGEAGIRLKSTGPLPSSSLVFDWRRSATVQPMNYQAVTAMFGQSSADGTCTGELWDAIEDWTNPTTFTGLTFKFAQAAYEPIDQGSPGRIAFMPMQSVTHGFAVRVPIGDLGNDGFTVWRGADRLHGGIDYLSQRDELTGVYVVYLPAPQTVGTQFVIAGPGGEPPP